MRGRAQFFATVIVVALLAAAGVYLQREVGPRAAAAAAPGTPTSGAWFCPHGGGPAGTKDWHAALAVANPGSSDVTIRVTDLGSEKPPPARSSTVPAGEEVLLPVPADAPESSTFVEYFGGWVSAGWVIRAQGDVSGVAAESCAPEADRSWNLADGVTKDKGDEDQLVIMNPFATDAALSVALYSSDRQPTRTKDLTDFVLPGERSVSIRVSKFVKGSPAVSAEIRVTVGRVAAATLGTSLADGVRSTEGVPGPVPQRVYLPGGGDRATGQLSVSVPGAQSVQLSGTVHAEKSQQLVAGLEQESQAGASAQSYDATIDGPSTFELAAKGGGIVAVARSVASDISHDEGATAGTPAPATAWLVPPAAFSEPASASLLLFDPGTEDVKVTLSAIAPADVKHPPPSREVTVPAGRTVLAPKGFVSAAPTSSILAVSSTGPIVAASAAYSEGEHGVGGFALVTGVTDPAEGKGP
jgi:hypothetical protein